MRSFSVAPEANREFQAILAAKPRKQRAELARAAADIARALQFGNPDDFARQQGCVLLKVENGRYFLHFRARPLACYFVIEAGSTEVLAWFETQFLRDTVLGPALYEDLLAFP
jgi:hypothetical protein